MQHLRGRIAKSDVRTTMDNWGEPERAPHRRVCCEFSIYLFIYRGATALLVGGDATGCNLLVLNLLVLNSLVLVIIFVAMKAE